MERTAVPPTVERHLRRRQRRVAEDQVSALFGHHHDRRIRVAVRNAGKSARIDDAYSIEPVHAHRSRIEHASSPTPILAVQDGCSAASVSPPTQCQVLKLQEELNVIRGETTVLNRELRGRVEQLSEDRNKLARLQDDLTKVKGQYAASQSDAEFQNVMESELVAAYQKLTAEMERLLKSSYRRPKAAAVGGIPVDSEYIIFVVDTSGSMQEYNWRAAGQLLDEILVMYPKVKGLQIMDDEGAYMFDGYRGQWIADTPARRKAIRDRFKSWTSFSNSSPVEGIQRASHRDPGTGWLRESLSPHRPIKDVPLLRRRCLHALRGCATTTKQLVI